MNILDRFILSIYTFCLAVISLFVMLITINVVNYSLMITYFDIIIKNSDYSRITFVVAFIFFLVSLRFLLSGTSRARNKSAIQKESQLGLILISLESIQNIITSELKNLDGIMDMKIDLVNRKDNVGIKLNVVVTPERNIPEFSTVIQSKTKEIVEKIAGVGVSFVDVMVKDVIQTIRPISKSKVI